MESVFINPKQIYETVNKDFVESNRKVGNYAYNDKQEREKIEKMNEYKNDINDLLLEEKEKQKIINTKEFSNYLNNKEYYNDRVLNEINNKETDEEKIKKKNDMFYLRQLAFKQIKEKTEKNNNFIGDTGNLLTDSDNEGKSKLKKNVNFENENQLRIGGKVYRMQNQMGEIAREILNKCKFYSEKKI